MKATTRADSALAVKKTGAGSGVDFISRSCFCPRSLASEMPKPRTMTLATPYSAIEARKYAPNVTWAPGKSGSFACPRPMNAKNMDGSTMLVTLKAGTRMSFTNSA